MDREEVYEIIDGERQYQDDKWGDQHDAGHEVEAYILYMEDYLREAREQVSRNRGTKLALDTLRKVVALAVACFEIHGVPPRDRGPINGDL